MEFPNQFKQSATIPAEIVGIWKIGQIRYQFDSDGKYWLITPGAPYQLGAGGDRLIIAGQPYSRIFGVPGELIGVWAPLSDPGEEWYFRQDGTFSYHGLDFEEIGEYSYTETEITTKTLRAFVTESAGQIAFDPPFGHTVTGSWELVGDNLQITFPDKVVTYETI